MTTDYQPPSSAQMLARQNEQKALRYLLAQRRLYSHAKRWLAARWLGMIVIGLAAPVVSVVWPHLAVASGAIAGAWIFLGRTVIQVIYLGKSEQAAALQEQFDFYVYKMPSLVPRKVCPTREDVDRLVGPQEQFDAAVESEKLRAWYSIDPSTSGSVAVAICQRSNASYANKLLRSTGIAWAGVTGSWIVLLAIGACVAKLSFATFLVGVLLPILPAFLDVVEYWFGLRRSARQRLDLSGTIEAALTKGAPQSEELLVWQEDLYALRRATPDVPDFIYDLERERNERAMHAAAKELSDEAQGGRE
jgi:SMODS-associating 4TM effector domain